MLLSTAKLQDRLSSQSPPWPSDIIDLLKVLDWIGLDLKWDMEQLHPSSENLQWAYWEHQLKWFDKLLGLLATFRKSERLRVPIVYPPVSAVQMNESVNRYRQVLEQRSIWNSFESALPLPSGLMLKWHRTKLILGYSDWRILSEQLSWFKWVSLPAGRFTRKFVQKQDVQNITIHLSRSVQILATPICESIWNWVMNDDSELSTVRYPKVSMRWWDACLFCNQLSRKFGFTPFYKELKADWLSRKIDPKIPAIEYFFWQENSGGFRLPTECEWLYMAGAGRHILRGPASQNHNEITPVTQWPQNEWGARGMYGPIIEWVWDTYVPDFWQKISGTVRDPKGPDYFDRRKVLVGETWKGNQSLTFEDRLHHDDDIGFRIVWDPGQNTQGGVR